MNDKIVLVVDENCLHVEVMMAITATNRRGVDCAAVKAIVGGEVMQCK